MAAPSLGTPLATPSAHDDLARPQDVDPSPSSDRDATRLGPNAGRAGQREAGASRPEHASGLAGGPGGSVAGQPPHAPLVLAEEGEADRGDSPPGGEAGGGSSGG